MNEKLIQEQRDEIERLRQGWIVMSQIPMSAHPSEIRDFAKKMLNGDKPYE